MSTRARPVAVRLGVGVGVVVAAAALVVLAQGDRSTTPLTITWDDSATRAGCVYEPDTRRVVVRLLVRGDAEQPATRTATVTAYADENTSRPVGSGSTRIEVDGHEDRSVRFDFPVSEPPHHDDDGVAACGIEVS